MIYRPMKAPSDAITDEQLNLLAYPLVGSPKLDGFRCIVQNRRGYTSSMKEFQNTFVRNELTHPAFDGLDGELVIGDPTAKRVFHTTSGPLRRFDGQPDFRFYAFDYIREQYEPYYLRWIKAEKPEHPRIVILEQRLLNSPQEVILFEREMLSLGFEGAMIRSLAGGYKQGRCTFNERVIFKRKPFVDCEAVIIGFNEAQQNCNEQEENELGLMRRSHKAEGMVPKGTLGSFVLKSELWAFPFNAKLGEGYTLKDAQDIWNNRDNYFGRIVTVNYQLYGSLDAPRIPRVTKFRPQFDLTEVV